MSGPTSPPGPFPVADPTTSFWLTEPSKLANYRSHPTAPEHVDVAIIGAGLAGVSAAYHLLRRLPVGRKLRVAIFEARSACSGATGRNGGHTKMSPVSAMQAHQRAGGKIAASLLRHARSQLWALKDVVEREQLECDFYLTRSYDIFFDGNEAAKARDWLAALRASDDPLREVVADVQYLEGPNLERVTNVRGLKGALSSPAASLWPYKFVTQLLARVLAMGGELYTHTPVRAVSYLENSGEDAVSVLHLDGPGTGAGESAVATTHAAHVIFATNGYSAGILPEYASVITPVRGTASHLLPTHDVDDLAHAPPFLTHTYNLRYTNGTVDYLIPRPDGSIILGGGKHTFAHDPALAWNNWDDAHLIEEARPHFAGRMPALYYGWHHCGARVNLLWTGVMGYTADGMPHVGAVPGKSGQWVAAGFNGGGMAMIFTATEALVRLLLKEVHQWSDLGLPPPFEPSEARLHPKSHIEQASGGRGH